MKSGNENNVKVMVEKVLTECRLSILEEAIISSLYVKVFEGGGFV